MKIESTLKQLETLVKGRTSLDQSFFVKNLTSLENAGPEDVAVVLDRGDASPFGPLEKERIKQSKAGAILARHEVVPGKPYLLVDDPLHAFVQLAQFAKQKEGDASQGDISPHASIHPDAHIGKGVTVAPFAVIEKGVRIGDYATISAHCFIGARSTIGDSTVLHAGVVIEQDCHVGAHATLHAGVVIGSDGFGYQVTQSGLRKIPHVGSVHIGNHVELGAGCCIDRATFDATVIGDGCRFDNMVHIAHNVSVGPSTAILAHTSIGGSVQIGTGCQIGSQVVVKDGIHLGDGARIVSKSAVLKPVEAGSTLCGQPAQSFREWKREHAALRTVAKKVLETKHEQPSLLALIWNRMMSFVRFPRGKKGKDE